MAGRASTFNHECTAEARPASERQFFQPWIFFSRIWPDLVGENDNVETEDGRLRMEDGGGVDLADYGQPKLGVPILKSFGLIQFDSV
jgi:hypothetical protein